MMMKLKVILSLQKIKGFCLFFLIDDDEKKKNYSGSRKGRLKSLPRRLLHGHESITRDYLSLDCVYPEVKFLRRFRMPSSLFKKMVEDIQHYSQKTQYSK
jgi:hypothetical protein